MVCGRGMCYRLLLRGNSLGLEDDELSRAFGNMGAARSEGAIMLIRDIQVAGCLTVGAVAAFEDFAGFGKGHGKTSLVQVYKKFL